MFDREDFFRRLINALESGPNILFVNHLKKQNWIVDDAGDNKFIACAILPHAEYIVSGDLHLKRAGKIGKVKIMPPREMMRFLETG
jgi:predicted nucleic acid-binding protein